MSRAWRRTCGVPGTRRLGLRDQRSAAPVRTAGCSRAGGRGPGGGVGRSAAAAAGGRTAAPRRSTVQLRAGDPSRRAARCGAEGTPAQLSRILRAAAFRGGRRHGRRRDRRRRPESAVRHRPAVRGGGRSGSRRACRDLRGPLDTGAAEFAGRAGGRDGAGQPVGQQHHHRQGGDPAAAVRLAIGAVRGGLSLRRGRRRRVHHRSRLGRSGLDLRERHDAGRDRAFPVRRPVRDGRYRPRSAASRAHADGQLRHQSPPPSRRVSPHRLPAGPAGRRYRSGARRRALSVRAGRSRTARAGLLRGLQHPGLRSGAAAARDRQQTGGDRRVGRARFHPRADRVRPGARPARAAAQQHPRLHDARLRHVRSHQDQRNPADGGTRRHLAGTRHPPRRRPHADAISAIRSRGANRSTT